jgi:hypothetical protein
MDTIQAKRLPHNSNAQVTAPTKNPLQKRLFKTFKRVILAMSVLLFCGFGYVTYIELHSLFGSRTGQAFTWSTATALSPVVTSLPWWFWGGVVGIAIYLWYKHTLVMSVVFGILAGLYLAL